MDAFTISICQGIKNKCLKDGLIVTSFFAIFQLIMPIVGYYLGNIFSNRLLNYHNYFSSLLLITIGVLMIKDNKDNFNKKINYKELIILSIATSIDALVIGISFSFNNTNIISAAIIIGIITFFICNIGYYLGNLLHKKFHQSRLIGGITLIILGIKLLFN